MSSSLGTVAVDFDGTLATYEGDQYPLLGQPIPDMIARVKNWIQLGYNVVIFTARVGSSASSQEATEQRTAVTAWLVEHLGRGLEVTATKSMDWVEIWDDRAVRVEKNTGCSELHDAHLILNAAGVLSGSLLWRLQLFVDQHVQNMVDLNKILTFDHDHSIEADSFAYIENDIITVQFVDGESEDLAAWEVSSREARCLAASLIRAADEVGNK
jgi:hypothetical protein